MIHISIPSLPISSNKAYTTGVAGGGKFKKLIRTLSAEGKKYKTETKGYIAREYPQELRFFNSDKPYFLVIKFTFHWDELYSTTWPEKAKNRYKKLDVSNRLKLFEDALAQATDLDDSHNFIVTVIKSHGTKHKTDLWAWNLEEERSPFLDYLSRLPLFP